MLSNQKITLLDILEIFWEVINRSYNYRFNSNKVGNFLGKADKIFNVLKLESDKIISEEILKVGCFYREIMEK